MRAIASNKLDWVVRAALVAGCGALVASSDGPALLWRNAIILVPLAAIVAMMCRWLPCRPVTRHTLWLVLLVWLVAGAIVPPVSFEKVDESNSTVATSMKDLGRSAIVSSPNGSLDAASEDDSVLPLSSVNQQASAQPATEGAIRRFETRPVDYSTKDDRPADDFGSESDVEEIARESVEPVDKPASPPSHSTTIRDADIVACGEFELPTADIEIPGGTCAETVPTPPLTVARTDACEPSRISSAAESDGQLSLFGSNVATWVSSRYSDLLVQLDDWSTPDAPARPFVGMTRIQARRLAEGWTPPRATNFSDDSTPFVGESNAFAEWIMQSYDSTGAFLSSRVKSWAEAIAGVRDAVGRLPAIPSAFWFAGIVLVLALRFRRSRRFRAIVQSGRRAPASIRFEVRAAAKEMGLKEAPLTLVVKNRISPMIWFDGLPTLVLPHQLWEDLDDEGRTAVLYHELAHLRRRDHWVCRIESLIGAIYWWHPLVWWIRGRLREEAENCCDAWVTWLQPGGRRAYAEALIRTNQFISQPSAPVPAGAIGMTSGPARRFARRLTMVMTQSVTPTTSRSTLILAIAVLATGWLSTPARSCDPKKDEGAGKTLVIAPVAPCTPVASTDPVQPTPAAPMVYTISTTAEPAMAPSYLTTVGGMHQLSELAPMSAIAVMDDHGGGHGGGHGGAAGGGAGGGAGGKNLEERIARLEERIARLTELLEGGRVAIARTPRAQAEPGAATPVPSSNSPFGAQGMAAMRFAETIPAPGQPGEIRARVAAPTGAVYARTYKIPEGRRDGIWELMALPDVPPRVRSVEGGIELQGTTEQHAAFGAFVDMICCEGGETVQGYHLPKQKLEAITALMSRSDVPVMVEAGDKEIRVHGTGAVQHIFRNFVNLIHPRQTSGDKVGAAESINEVEGAAWGGDADVAHKMALEQELVAAAQHEHAKHAEHEKHAAHAGKHERMNAESDALRQAAEELMQQAAQLEAEADRLSDEADALSDRASEMLEEVEESGSGDRTKAAREEAKVMEARARDLEKASQKLYSKAAKLDKKGSELEEKAERMAEELEAAAEAAAEADEAAATGSR